MIKPAVIVIGTSAGGIEALRILVSKLQPDFPIPLLVVMHVSPEGSVLPEILTRAGALPAHHPKDGERIEAGRIYVAPPNRHMTVHRGAVRVVHGPKENRHRPAIDPLFRSAAAAYGHRTVGVILTGLLDDGTAGLRAIKKQGGTAVVQDPKDALYTGMPLSAIERVAVDHVLPVAEIPALLLRLASESSHEISLVKDTDAMEPVEFAEFDPTTITQEPSGTPISLSCPDCHGTLWETTDDDLSTFRCRTGHSFTPAFLIAGQAEGAENSLWNTLRALEEQASLFRHLATAAQERKLSESTVAHFLKSAEEKDKAAASIRDLLMSNEKFREDSEQTG